MSVSLCTHTAQPHCPALAGPAPASSRLPPVPSCSAHLHREGHVHAPPSWAGRVPGSVPPGASLHQVRGLLVVVMMLAVPVSCGTLPSSTASGGLSSFHFVDVPTLQVRRKGSETGGNLLPTTQLGRGGEGGSRCWSRNPWEAPPVSDCFSGRGHCALRLQA